MTGSSASSSDQIKQGQWRGIVMFSGEFFNSCSIYHPGAVCLLNFPVHPLCIMTPYGVVPPPPPPPPVRRSVFRTRPLRSCVRKQYLPLSSGGGTRGARTSSSNSSSCSGYSDSNSSVSCASVESGDSGSSAPAVNCDPDATADKSSAPQEQEQELLRGMALSDLCMAYELQDKGVMTGATYKMMAYCEGYVNGARQPPRRNDPIMLDDEIRQVYHSGKRQATHDGHIPMLVSRMFVYCCAVIDHFSRNGFDRPPKAGL